MFFGTLIPTEEFTEPNIIILIIALSVLILIAWSPWITKIYAEKRVVEAFQESQKDISDGCGFNCVGCGINNSNKVLFGYSVDIEYGCGMRPTDRRDLNERATIFVSFIGTVH
ncbi:MAG: hypothetical protein HYW26_04610 [Candidatus Aenigmarchaeota archaeon]|nr:hypothetical protein [Candidatus Aenigmarchaeota archaeon]